MSFIISIIVFLFPLFFFPLMTNPVFGAKNLFFGAAVAASLIFAGFKLILYKKQENKLTYSTAPLDVFVFLFLLVNIISWYFLPQGARVRSLIQPIGLGSVIVFTFFYLIVAQSNIKEKFNYILYSLTASSVILSLVSIILFILPESYAAGWVGYLNFLTFGSPFILGQFLALISILLITKIVSEINQQGEVRQWWLAVATVIIVVGLGTNIYRAVQVKPPLLDWFSSWATTVEAFKRKPVFGVGPQNYNTAFNRFRPREFNQTEFWNIRFGAPHSWFLQVWAELGIVGLAVIVLLLIRGISVSKTKPVLKYFLISTWLVLLIFPGNLIAVFLLFLGLGLVRGKGKEKEFNLVIGEKSQHGATYLLGGGLIILGLAGGYFLYNLFLPEVTFFRAIQAAAENKGAETYDLQFKAINQNRFIQTYRISFSQTNLAFATNLVLQSQEQGRQLSEEEAGQLQQLISQAVDQARAAVALEPQNVVGWENLAQVYRRLIGIVENADQWAITSYQQAISLDSINPRLRVDFGGLLYAFGQYEEAARQFEIAVNLKNDYANAWYNWAYALKEQDKLQAAVERLQQAANLVDREGADYQTVQSELDEWLAELDEEERPIEAEPATEEITRPDTLPETQLDEPIVLPDDAAPPLDEGVTAPEEETEI